MSHVKLTDTFTSLRLLKESSLTGVMWERALAGVRIVLVEPGGPLNVGAIARVMKNLGLQQLVLVNSAM